MKISIIVAMDQKGTIGRGNVLPWHLSSDLKNFKKLTMGKPIIMGRKTYESIGKPLEGRKNIIVTRNEEYNAKGCDICPNINEALSLYNEEEVVIIGGREIYQIALPLAHRIYLTEVHAKVEGDVFFPIVNRTEWDEIERVDFNADCENEYPFSTLILEKRHHLDW